MTFVLAAVSDALLGGAITAAITGAAAWAVRRAPKTKPETAIDEGTALVQQETARAREVERWETLMDELVEANARLKADVAELRRENAELRRELDAERTARRRDRRDHEAEISELRRELAHVRSALDAKR